MINEPSPFAPQAWQAEVAFQLGQSEGRKGHHKKAQAERWRSSSHLLQLCRRKQTGRHMTKCLPQHFIPLNIPHSAPIHPTCQAAAVQNLLTWIIPFPLPSLSFPSLPSPSPVLGLPTLPPTQNTNQSSMQTLPRVAQKFFTALSPCSSAAQSYAKLK